MIAYHLRVILPALNFIATTFKSLFSASERERCLRVNQAAGMQIDLLRCRRRRRWLKTIYTGVIRLRRYFPTHDEIGVDYV